MYRTRYEDSAFVPRAYAERCRDLLRAACKKHGIGQRSPNSLNDGQLLTRDVGIPQSMREPESQLFPASALAGVPRKPPQRASMH
jgi:hypothetical protein